MLVKYDKLGSVGFNIQGIHSNCGASLISKIQFQVYSPAPSLSLTADERYEMWLNCHHSPRGKYRWSLKESQRRLLHLFHLFKDDVESVAQIRHSIGLHFCNVEKDQKTGLYRTSEKDKQYVNWDWYSHHNQTEELRTLAVKSSQLLLTDFTTNRRLHQDKLFEGVAGGDLLILTAEFCKFHNFPVIPVEVKNRNSDNFLGCWMWPTNKTRQSTNDKITDLSKPARNMKEGELYYETERDKTDNPTPKS